MTFYTSNSPRFVTPSGGVRERHKALIMTDEPMRASRGARGAEMAEMAPADYIWQYVLLRRLSLSLGT
jgi:hypothetical protein